MSRRDPIWDVPPVSILTYHNIVDGHQETPNDLHSISIDRLNAHLTALKEARFIQIPLAAAFEVLVNGRAHQAAFALTFDDGYASLLKYRHAIQVSVGPTIFIISGYTGKSTLSWNTRSSRVLEHLCLDGIRTLKDQGFDIQMHGADHHNLLKFNPPELRERFEISNRWFSSHLGQPPEYLAYPYGYCDERIKAVVSEYYLGALSVSHGQWQGEAARYALNRVSIPYYLSGGDVVDILRVSPEHRWYEIEKRAPWRNA